jgi:nudix-type nucleoside diphosphatase (YffH/AdpP family)
MTFKNRVLEQRIVYDGFWTIRRVSVENTRKDGSVRRLEREVAESRDAAVVLPLDPARGVVMLARQFRLPAFLSGARDSLLEACAGLIDDGEDAAACAIREAREELGLELESVQRICEIYPSPGVTTERMSLFVARYDETSRTGDGGGLAQEGEEIEIVELALDAALAMIESGEIVDAKTIVLLQCLALRRIP